MTVTSLDRRALLALALCACGRRASVGSRPVRRIVSTAPNTTELLFDLGFGPRVVGVSSHDDYPTEVSALPKVGSFATLSFEAIVALRPDAVIGAQGIRASLVSQLEAMGIRTLYTRAESLAQVRALAQSIAQLCGEPSRAVAWLRRFDSAIASASISRRPGRAAPRVLAVVDQRPIVCAGPGSYIHELLDLVGADNALVGTTQWPTLSIEQVMAARPDCVIDLTGPLGGAGLRSTWSEYRVIPAVRDGHVETVSDPLVTRPGPRAPLAMGLLASAIYRARLNQDPSVNSSFQNREIHTRVLV